MKTSKQENLVSIVVPVYKVEKLLPRCVDSLLAQDYPNIEIILVDDGSPDNCGQIIDQYVQDFPDKVKCIHQENQGLGKTRNNGLAKAEGEWVCFVDSDDYVEENYVSTLLHTALSQEAELAVCGIYLEKEKGNKVLYPLYFPRKVLSGPEAAKRALNMLSIPNYAWNKIYNRAFLKKIEFAYPSIYFEDVSVCAKTMYQAEKVAFSNKPLYHYVLRSSSLVGTFNLQKLDQALEALEMVVEFVQEVGKKENWNLAWKRLLLHLRILFTTQLMTQLKDKSISERKEMVNYLNERLKDIDRKYKLED